MGRRPAPSPSRNNPLDRRYARLHYPPASQDDEAALWTMLFYAAHMHDEPGQTVQDAKTNDFLAKYVADWGRDGDLGYVALDNDGQPLGAAWVRLFTQDEADPTTPELAVAVLPTHTGQGIGTRLMHALLAEAAHHYPAVMLNVRADNPAIRLYQRLGFRTVGDITNRVGTTSYDMRFDFST